MALKPLTGHRGCTNARYAPMDNCNRARSKRNRCAAAASTQQQCSTCSFINGWKQVSLFEKDAPAQRWHTDEHRHSTAACWTTGLLATVVSMQLCGSADARVATEKLMQQEPSIQTNITAGFDPSAAAAARGTAAPRGYSNEDRRQQPSIASAAADALQQLTAAQAASKAGDYQAALAKYTQVVQQHPDLALAEYARLGRALMLYEVGDVSKSIIALEDQEISMRGYPEVHAALAAVLYAERPTQRLRAEQQFDIAVEFDSHFQDVQWVATNKHWGPRLQGALQKFLLLQ